MTHAKTNNAKSRLVKSSNTQHTSLPRRRTRIDQFGSGQKDGPAAFSWSCALWKSGKPGNSVAKGTMRPGTQAGEKRKAPPHIELMSRAFVNEDNFVDD